MNEATSTLAGLRTKIGNNKGFTFLKEIRKAIPDLDGKDIYNTKDEEVIKGLESVIKSENNIGIWINSTGEVRKKEGKIEPFGLLFKSLEDDFSDLKLGYSR